MKYQYFFLVFVVMKMFADKNSLEWLEPTGKEMHTIFYQGMLSSQVQAARYTAKKGFIATTGERVYCPHGLDIIHNLYIGSEIDEVVPWRAQQYKKSFWKSIKARFHRLISQAANKRDGIEVEANHKGPSLKAHIVRLKKVNIAQENDLINHQHKYELCCKEHVNGHIGLFGVSRGAATTFIAVSCNQYDLSKIKFVILEGCFDSVEHLIQLRVPLLGNLGWSRTLLNKLLYSVFGDYRFDGVSPLSVVDKFPHSVPVLFVTSKKDKNVPYESTMQLAKELVKTGHKQVYVLILKSSGHNGYYKDSPQDRAVYKAVVHAFYRMLGMPHIPFYAEQGAELLNSCKMSE